MADPTRGYTTAREHALRASELLNGIDRQAEVMSNLNPDEHLQMVAMGGIAHHNQQIEFWRNLALAHAQAAIALAMTDEHD